MAKERANAPLGLFFSSFSSHARRLGTVDWLVKSLWVGTMEGLLDSALVEP